MSQVRWLEMKDVKYLGIPLPKGWRIEISLGRITRRGAGYPSEAVVQGSQE